jgi:hemerythrin superfamily protein
MAVKFELTMDVKKITAQISSISGRGKKWDRDVQTCALSIVQHVNEHHEVSLVNLLVDSMPKGSRSNALREWFVKHGKVVFNEEDQIFMQVKTELRKDFQLAIDEQWTECKPEPAFKPLDLQVQIDRLFDRAQKAASSDRKDEHAIPSELLEYLGKVATTR